MSKIRSWFRRQGIINNILCLIFLLLVLYTIIIIFTMQNKVVGFCYIAMCLFDLSILLHSIYIEQCIVEDKRVFIDAVRKGASVKLLTSYYSNYRKFPEGSVQVAISLTVPDGYKGLRYTKVCPTQEILKEYKSTNDEVKYTEMYNKNILNKLDQDEVIGDLYDMIGDDDVAVIFLCYEKSSDFCHRKLFAKWLNNAGYECEELV